MGCCCRCPQRRRECVDPPLVTADQLSVAPTDLRLKGQHEPIDALREGVSWTGGRRDRGDAARTGAPRNPAERQIVTGMDSIKPREVEPRVEDAPNVRRDRALT